ncbi:S8 family serine peptidase [Paenibacillus sp. IITD108]|uniref:S8 family serine peptidase n=1 Tax=Paenibacillus sp. IITD108 TaxID=3116649 RepID=UPI002F3E270E
MKKIIVLCLILVLICTIIPETGINAVNSDINANSIVQEIENEIDNKSETYTEEIDEINFIKSVVETPFEGNKEKYLIKFKQQNQRKSFNMEIVNATNDDSIGIINSLDVISLELTESQLEELINSDIVENYEKDQQIELSNITQQNINDNIISSGNQIVPWGIYSTGAYYSNSVSPEGEKVKVAIFDTGIAEHPELPLSGGVSFVESEEGFLDEHGHGTQIAGSIAAIDDNRGIVGSTNNIELYAVKTIDSMGKGYISSVIKGIDWAIDNDIQIINLSFVVNEYSLLLHEAIQNAYNNGLLIIAAAGNKGMGENTILYPALFPEVLAVGAIDKSHNRASFSSTGPELDLVAPGSLILTTNRFGGYSVTSGTSIAAAHVTGAAALIMSKRPYSTPSEITELIKNSSTNLGESFEYGNGLINVAKALGLRNEPFPPISTGGIEIDETNIWIPSNEDGELNIASYDQVGDGQIIFAGETARVSVKLNGNQNGQNIHEKIEVSVYPVNDNHNIILYDEILNPVLFETISFQWETTESILPGMYMIKFHYPARPTGEDDDYFVIHIQQKGNAAPTNLVAIPSGNSIKFSWTPPLEAISYSIMLNGNFIAETSETTFTFNNLQPLTQYRLAVAAIYPENKISNYSEIVVRTTIEELIVYTPIDVEQEASERKFLFRPASNGVYRFFTSENFSNGKSSDTLLKIYADSQMTQLLASNDDYDGSIFSEIRQSMSQGKEYYISLSTFGNASLSARIVAEVITSEIPYIQQDIPVDVNELAGNSTVYIFVPSTSGKYNIFTSFYSGRMSSRQNDTQLSVFSDINLTSRLPNGFNDDTDDSVFSEVSISLTRGIPYYVKINGFDDTKVYARLLVNKTIEVPIPLESKSPQVINKLAGEYELFQFSPSVSGKYRLFTSPSILNTNQSIDTEIKVYSDSSLINIIAQNDDVKGNKPYGSLYSMLEHNLIAGNNYYIIVSNHDSSSAWSTRFMIEDSFHSNRENAQVIQWDELIEKDSKDNLLTISSLYDVDYFRLQLDEFKQVSFNLEKASGSIEDEQGNVLVYIGNLLDSVFEFHPGTYYIRIQHDVRGKTGLMHSSLFNEYPYWLGSYINEIDYGPDNINLFSRASASCKKVDPKAFDATPGQHGCVQFDYKNKVNTDGLIFDVFAKNQLSIKVYSGNLGSKYANTNTVVKWDGTIDDFTDKYANYREVKVLPAGYTQREYYAKNGKYNIMVYPKGKKKYQVTYEVSVSNDATNEYNWVPIPPMEDEYGKEVTAGNKGKCNVCRNYYYRYVYDINSDIVPDTGYAGWSAEIYGKNGMERFWSTIDPTDWDDNKSIIDNIQELASDVGMIPVIGEWGDGFNAVTYLIRGKYVDSVISAASLFPFMDWIIKGGKRIRVSGLKKYTPTYAKNPCNCFAEGTTVLTNNGHANIENIKIGDLVLSKNEITGDLAYKEVENIFEKTASELYVINAGGIDISTTYNHPFWVVDKGWVIAEDLVVGDQLQTSNSELVKIDNIIVKQQSAKVYNLTVADYHTYFATELEIFTHNLDCYNYDINKLSTTLSKAYPKSATPSTILGSELTKSGYSKPNISQNGITNWEAHHIVPAGDKRFPSAVRAKTILEKYKIDVNSSANGIWLPVKKGHVSVDVVIDETTQVILKTATHNGGHTQNYYEYVLKQIEKYDGHPNAQQEIVKALQKIRNDLLSGEIVIGKLK